MSLAAFLCIHYPNKYCACSGHHSPHPEDAIAFPLALVRVDCHGTEACHLGDRLTQQISPQFTVDKHHHWRLVQLTVLKCHKESGEILYIHIFFAFYNISPYRYFNNYIHSELLCILTIWVLNFDLLCYRAASKGQIEIVKILQQMAVMALKSATWHAKEKPHPPLFRLGCK